MPNPKIDFETNIPERIAKDPEGAKNHVGAIYLFTITGDDGGVWTVDLKDEPGVREGDDGTAQCKIEISADDWQTVSDDPSTAMNMFMTGKLRVSGDVLLATKLQQVLRA